MFYFANYISVTFLGVTGYDSILKIILVASPFIVVYSLVEAYLKGKQEINLLLKINIISSILTVLFIYPLLYYFDFEGIAFYFIVLSIIPLIIYSILERKEIKELFRSKIDFNSQIIKNILKIGSVSLFSSFLFQFSILHLRKFIILNFDTQFAGIYQSLLGLSMNYFILIYSFLSTYSLPKIASLNVNHEINSEINEQFRFLLFIIVPMILLILTFRYLFLKIFYTAEFLDASNLFYIQIFGDLFKSFGALFSIWLIPRMKIKVLMSIDFCFNLTFIALPYLLINIFPDNIIIIPITYAASYFVHFVLICLYTYSSINFRFNKNSMKNIVVSILTIIAGIVINVFIPNASYFIIFVLLGFNAYLIIDRQEYSRIKIIVKNYIYK